MIVQKRHGTSKIDASDAKLLRETKMLHPTQLRNRQYLIRQRYIIRYNYHNTIQSFK